MAETAFLPDIPANFPHTLTILGTYQCTAACTQCCFESSPKVTGRLTGDQILSRISEAKAQFQGLKLVVFSGGEAFLLKEDLFAAVAHASSLDLYTRIVSNGSWAKSIEHALLVADKLKKAGITEINISTGVDHQEWVPLTSVINAAFALMKKGIPVLVTVEADSKTSDCLKQLAAHPVIRDGLRTKTLRLQGNSWMPFHADAEEREVPDVRKELRSGCKQIFESLVVTPHDNLSACCGLTLEHIPEMRLGKNDGTNMSALYASQLDDFLKYWIYMDGPYSIIERLAGPGKDEYLSDVVHICQACAILHKTPALRTLMAENFEDYVPEVLSRFAISQAELLTVSPSREGQ